MSMMPRNTVWGALATLSMLMAGCSNVEKAKPQPQSARVDPAVKIDVPEIMRGTIAAHTVVLGYDENDQGHRPVIARGYGLVVGLNGTGAADMAPQLRAHMLTEASRGGFGNPKFGDQAAMISPEQLLNSPNTGVVVIEAIIPQGAVKGTRFDVRVYAEPSTSTTSLEGGRLYTSKLRPGPLRTGGTQAFELAEASGPIFVNPFSEPGAVGRDSIDRRSGRILNGGVVVKDMPLKLRLANPSHAQAAIICTAINTRFPQEPAQGDPTARGESDDTIDLTVPPSFQGRTDEFIDLLRHTTIAQANPEAVAMSIKRALQANPVVAPAAALRWQALGARVLPMIKDLYDHAEDAPRFAALQAGAKLNDALVVPPLIDMAAHSASTEYRIDAIKLLGGMELNPRIDLALRELLDDPDVEIRLETYEALVERHDPVMRRINVDGKFVVDVVPSTQPLIYITQIGQPRIVVFGEELALQLPLTISAWSNRLMVKGDSDQEKVEVYYRSLQEQEGTILKAEPDLVKFVQFLGHKTTIEEPAPGLGLGYGETVGAIHHIWTQKYIKADFKAEQDRILAAILRQQRERIVEERPEFMNDDQASDVSPADDPASQPSDLGRLLSDQPNQPG